MLPKHGARTDARVIVALDSGEESALAFAGRVQPTDCKLKVGLELFTAAGPDIVHRLIDRGFDVFLDLKFHDIPNTVAMACARAAELGVWMLNVHAFGGGDMMQAAAAAVRVGAAPPRLIAVTVLTSHKADAFHAIGAVDLAPTATALAQLARAAGLDGVVCSGHEAATLRAEFGTDFLLVTPGIRFAGTARDDQVRVMTPAQAIRAGADYLVLGRPITCAADPLAALAMANEQVAAA